jgi:signal transduction histidine kinase/ActR/RegA family two-component response regulator
MLRADRYRPVNLIRIAAAAFIVYMSARWGAPALLYATGVFLGFAVVWWLLNEADWINPDRQRRLVFLPTGLDILVITFFAYFTGAYRSPALVGYLYAIAVCAMNVRSRQGLFAAVFSAASYAAVGAAAVLQSPPPPNLLGDFAPYNWTGFVVANGLFIMVAAGLLTIVRRLSLEKIDLIEAARREQEEAQRSNQLMRLFLANMSHEVRTPLNAVNGMAELLADSPLDPEQMEYARSIQTNGRQLLRLINDILDLSRIEAGALPLHLETFSLRTALAETLAMFRLDIERLQHDVRLEYSEDAPDWIEADPLRLRQAAANLLGNAIKFTPPGGVIRMRVDAAPGLASASAALRIEVRDNGPGFPPAKLPELFEPFRQLDPAATRTASGAGLGLAITRRLLHLMGGDLTGENLEEGGASFVMRLPVRVALAPPAAANPEEQTDRHAEYLRRTQPLILIVDDNPANRSLVARFLDGIHARFDIASDGLEALEKLRDQNYDVILLDVQMPVLNGLDTARAIREMTALAPQPRIIGLTANAYPEDRLQCLDAGMDDYLAKPVGRRELYEKIAAILQRPLGTPAGG